jgi:hypothetical protein
MHWHFVSIPSWYHTPPVCYEPNYIFHFSNHFQYITLPHILQWTLADWCRIGGKVVFSMVMSHHVTHLVTSDSGGLRQTCHLPDYHLWCLGVRVRVQVRVQVRLGIGLGIRVREGEHGKTCSFSSKLQISNRVR